MMESTFWRQKWENHEIGFHRSEVNPSLAKYFSKLSLSEKRRVFLPLCGKTLDIKWLIARHYRVAGIELVETAVEQLFDELGMEPEIAECGNMKRYSAANIDIFTGDIFELTGKMLGSVDAIYDRAALVALPEDMRKRYTAHLTEITKKAPQLLVVYEYDQSLMEGPPFSISNEEIKRHYRDSYKVSLIEDADIKGGLKSIREARKKVWLLETDRSDR